MRCLACGRFQSIPALHTANLALGIDTPAIAHVAPPVHVIPPTPTLEFKLVELPAPPSAESPLRPSVKPEQEEDPLYRLADADGNSIERKKMDRKKVLEALAAAKLELAKRERLATWGWPLEKNWVECLAYPVRALPYLGGLGLAWATAIVFFDIFAPHDLRPSGIVRRFPFVLIYCLLLGYTCACLKETLAAARAGHVGSIAWPERSVPTIASGCVQCLWCFVAGPIVPTVAAILFWLEGGDFEAVDWFIVLELDTVAVAYWALALLAVQETGQFRMPIPWPSSDWPIPWATVCRWPRCWGQWSWWPMVWRP